MDEVQITKVVTLEKVASIDGWGSEEPASKRPKWSEWKEAQEYFAPCKWGDPETETQKKSLELKILYEKDRIIFEDGTTLVRSKRKEFEDFRLSF